MAIGLLSPHNVIHHRWKFVVRVADWTNDIFSQSNFVANLCTFWNKRLMFSTPSLDSTVHDRWNAAEGVLKWTWSCWLQVVFLMCEAAFCFYVYLLFRGTKFSGFLEGSVRLKATLRWFQFEINWETLNTVLYKVMYNCEKSFSWKK